MKWKIFLQIILLIVITGVVFYNVCPKYDYIDDQTPDLVRFNRITGNLEVCREGTTRWERAVSRATVRVERPIISYEEFMQGRMQFLKTLQQLEREIKKEDKQEK